MFFVLDIQLVITHKQEEGTNKYSTPLQEVKRGASSIVINLSEAIVVQGDVKLEFFYKPKMMMRKVTGNKLELVVIAGNNYNFDLSTMRSNLLRGSNLMCHY